MREENISNIKKSAVLGDTGDVNINHGTVMGLSFLSDFYLF